MSVTNTYDFGLPCIGHGVEAVKLCLQLDSFRNGIVFSSEYRLEENVRLWLLRLWIRQRYFLGVEVRRPSLWHAEITLALHLS